MIRLPHRGLLHQAPVLAACRLLLTATHAALWGSSQSRGLRPSRSRGCRLAEWPVAQTMQKQMMKYHCNLFAHFTLSSGVSFKSSINIFFLSLLCMDLQLVTVWKPLGTWQWNFRATISGRCLLATLQLHHIWWLCQNDLSFRKAFEKGALSDITRTMIRWTQIHSQVDATDLNVWKFEISPKMSRCISHPLGTSRYSGTFQADRDVDHYNELQRKAEVVTWNSGAVMKRSWDSNKLTLGKRWRFTLE